MKIYYCFIFLLSSVLVACTGKPEPQNAAPALAPIYKKGTFGYDLEFLKKHHPDLVLLSDEQRRAQVVVLPAYQGRVMSSTASGVNGTSFGWINHDLIASGKPAEHIHVFGGEERLWLGPEGGQFSIFFKKGTPFNFDNWFVPKELDTEPFQLTGATASEASFQKQISLENHSGTRFDLLVKRHIRLLKKSVLDSLLGISLPGSVECVGFESENTLENIGTHAWEKKSGLLSIWILSMLNASPSAMIAIPYKQGDEKMLGKIVTDDYFGKVPAERLKVENGLILFNADGQKRSKIGISPARALPIAASWDAANGVLTIAQFSLPARATDDYVNSLWEMQKEPYRGDAVNAYNDGPNDSGAQLGAFYELESSSPAAALKPGEKLTHVHRTIHLKGTAADLEAVSMRVLGVGLGAVDL